MSEAARWLGAMGQQWARFAVALDRQLEPAGTAGLKRLRPTPGEVILDLGCGSGATTFELAKAVGMGGSVTGIDISADQIAVAQSRSTLAQARFVTGDAAAFPFPAESFDAVFSRFGCMFFDEPVAAFKNVLRALKPGGRLVLVVWADPAQNPWSSIPMSIADEVLGPVEPAAPGTPGPFAWSDPAIFRPILQGAGLQDLVWSAVSITLTIGEESDAEPTERAALMLTRVGPLARRLADRSDTLRAEAIRRLKAALAPFVEGDWVRMPGAIWLIEARRS